jgi:hypothetical protein
MKAARMQRIGVRSWDLQRQRAGCILDCYEEKRRRQKDEKATHHRRRRFCVVWAEHTGFDLTA